MKIAKHEKVQGSFKTAIFYFAYFCIGMGLLGFFTGDAEAGAGGIIFGLVIGGIGSLIPNKNRVEWKD